MRLQSTTRKINLLFFNENATRLVEKGNMVDVVSAFIISQAFNTVICNALIGKMEHYG